MAHKKAKPSGLLKLVEQAIEIIQDERDVAQSSFQDVNGRITNVDDRAEIARYDRWLKAARTELGKSPSNKSEVRK